jgi:hypothetical protein
MALPTLEQMTGYGLPSIGLPSLPGVGTSLPWVDMGNTYGLPQGYTIRDNGRGTNEILDTFGNVVGKGYDDIDTTLREWQRENVLGSVKKVDVENEIPFVARTARTIAC